MHAAEGPSVVAAVPAAALLALAAVLLWLLAIGAAAAFDRQRMLATARAMGPATVLAANELLAGIQQAQAQPDAQRLQTLNRFVNRHIGFIDDLSGTGQQDEWASPLESLGRGFGDCEDYTIAKYFALMAAGTPRQRMRLVYVRADVAGRSQAHMVLAVYGATGGEPVILDNLVADIRPASARTDLTPIFSFNADGLWQGTGNTAAGDPLARLSRWGGVIAKARAEGFLP